MSDLKKESQAEIGPRNDLLDQHLADARIAPPLPEDLQARILADAARLQTNRHRKPAARDLFANWPSVAGLAGGALAGIVLGFFNPTLVDVTTSYDDTADEISLLEDYFAPANPFEDPL
ncbi:hypothetical protein [Litoreibacter roseus]|uniref:DUF3619 family protein n=1 Tax=Litoreibacter roseus TaxID=2601869 RepID=A0A6N6JJG7_9RHOB|nr:hypothetical protein [Litoreibacter roseus]GFE65418.1 hypothetical protein KIN_24920 [Litoreibacter roseus]